MKLPADLRKKKIPGKFGHCDKKQITAIDADRRLSRRLQGSVLQNFLHKTIDFPCEIVHEKKQTVSSFNYGVVPSWICFTE